MKPRPNDDERLASVNPAGQAATFRLLFEHNPLPMWVYDLETLAFLEVNEAAIEAYGYSREDFLQMRITDIRPEEDVPALLDDVRSPRPALQQRAAWRHRRKDGTLLDVEISSHTFPLQDRDAVLVVARDVTAQRRAEQERALLAAIVASSHEVIISKDLDGTITSWNEAAERFFGYSAAEAIGQSTLMLIPPDRPEEADLLLERIQRGERVEHFETVRRAKDGRALAVSLTVSPIRDGEGRIVGASKVLHDITERKRIETELKEQEARYRSIVTNAPVLIVVLDREGVYTLSEGRGLDRLGFGPGEMVGLSVFELFADYPHVLDHVRAGLAGEAGAWTTDVDGVHFDAFSSPIFGEDGQVESLVIVATDVTERHEAQQRLEFLYRTMGTLLSLDQERNLRRFAEAVVPALADWCALHVVDEGGAVERVALVHRDASKVARAAADRVEHAIALDAEMGPGRVLRTGEAELYPEIPDALIAALGHTEERRRQLRALGFVSGLIVPLVARGRTLGVLTLATAESGRRFGPEDLAMAEDLAQRAALAIDSARLFEASQRANTALEERVQERTAQLEAANQELESFSYSVSHDLRSPLRAIEGFTRILVENHADELSPKAEGYLQRVRRNALRMGALIDDLLQLSRLSRKELQRKPVRPARIVREILEELDADEREVQIEVGELPVCQADPVLLKQVYANLIGNAMKFSQYQSPAVVRIGAEQRDGEVVYFVADNGAGFDMRYVDKVFGVFQRLHRAEEYEGTGVGLAIVQRIVHGHGGEVWADAVPGEGATFYFTVPPDSSPRTDPYPVNHDG